MFWLFSLDKDDPTLDINDLQQFLKSWGVGTDRYKIVVGESEGKIDAINRDIKQLHIAWDILLNISDDQFPIVQGYDDIIRNAMPDDLDASLWFFDSYQQNINTQEILGRAYYLRHGYVYHPSYKSLFCDNEATIVAQRLGKLIKNDRMIIRHVHPCTSTTAKNDALYAKNNLYWTLDKANLALREAINFANLP